jgi:predicted permease
MGIHVRVISSIAGLVALICFAMLLRHWKLLDEGQGKLFAKLVTQVTLPAVIVVSLARTSVLWTDVELALYMLGAELICLALGWLIGRALKLDAKQMGSVILVSGFGSSSLLGYALINEVYPGDPNAMTEAVVVSELGVGPALFILGTMIAMYYGSSHATPGARLKAAVRFFRSPIFFSVLVGLALSASLGTDRHPVVLSILDGLHVAGAANTFLVALTVGLLLHFAGFSEIAVAAGLVFLVKLIVKPIMLWLPTFAMALPDWQLQVLILEAAMPSAMLTVVLADSYGCDSRLASRLVFSTTVASAVTVPVMFEVLA